MKNLVTLALLIVLAVSFSVSNAQDNSSYESKKMELIGQPIAPDLAPRAPVEQNNSILFLSNCPPQDRPTCLKEPFDSGSVGWIICPFVGATPPAYRNDDLSTASIPLPFTFNLYGIPFTSVFINNNGNITFTGPLSTFTPTAFPSSVFGAIVAPFFADVDTRNLASGLVYYKIEPTRLTVVWDSTGYFSVHVDKRNTFQLIISNGADPVVGIGNNVCFSYGDMAWTTGDASGGIGGFGGAAATVGVNKGDGVIFATLGRFSRPGTYYGGPGVDTNGVSYLDCQDFCLNATNSGNICPIAQNFPGGNVNISAGTPYLAQYAFAAPEVTQIVSASVSGVPPGMSVLVTNGLTATFDILWNPTCNQVGTYVVCFTGIDNATAPCTTTVCVTYVVDCPLPVELSSFTSTVTGRDVSLNWSTTMEENNARFEIERSSSENSWINVGNVAGNGTSSVPHAYLFVDRGLNSGLYNYRLKQVDYNGNFSYHNLSNEVSVGTPDKYSLNQNYPNPFNPSTKISYTLPVNGKVSLVIFDASGREVQTVVNDLQTAGFYSVNFDGSKLSSGVYYYRISVSGTNNFVDTRKMLLIK